MSNVSYKVRPCILLLFSFCSLLQSCEEEVEDPNFSDVPRIEFLNTQVLYVKGIRYMDTLLITIEYQDGDGDLGLETRILLEYPYHEFNYFNGDPPYNVITDLDSFSGTLLKLGDKPGGMDTLPAYNLYDNPIGIDCINYELIHRENDNYETYYDTVYIQRNRNHYNFYLDFFIKSEDGYEEFDFLKETCISSDGVFPKKTLVGTPFVIHKSSKWEGTITYKFTLPSIKSYFGGKTIKLRMSIKDRALNESNVVESKDIFIRE